MLEEKDEAKVEEETQEATESEAPREVSVASQVDPQQQGGRRTEHA